MALGREESNDNCVLVGSSFALEGSRSIIEKLKREINTLANSMNAIRCPIPGLGIKAIIFAASSCCTCSIVLLVVLIKLQLSMQMSNC